jgi:hypothetical protein
MSKKFMNKKFLLFLLVLVLITAFGIGGSFYLSSKKKFQPQPPQQEGPTTPKPERVEKTKEGKIKEFVPLKSPPSPPFLESLNEAKDVKIDFHYEGDYPSFGPEPEFYIPEGSNEKFLSLSKTKREIGRYVYGPEYYSIFNPGGSHWYGGTPIYLLNPKSEYSVSYVGFQINDRDLISELKIEFGIDYFAEENIGKSEPSIFTSIFSIEPVYACGPGLYLRPVGESNLIFVEESNGISWYRLEKPIALYNLRLSYCDVDCSLMPNYCPPYEWEEPPTGCEEYSCCYYNVEIPNLAKGNLRMHILYKPNDKEGFLKIQVVNLILSDPAGKYYQPIMGKNFDHYYRAYLH